MATDQVTRHKRLKRFERLVRAYRVRPENDRWIVKKIGGLSLFSVCGSTISMMLHATYCSNEHIRLPAPLEANAVQPDYLHFGGA